VHLQIIYGSFDFVPGVFVGLSEERNSIHEDLGKKWLLSIILGSNFIKCCRLKLEEGAEKKKE